MKNSRGLGRRLGKAFLLQAAFISLTAIFSVYAARVIIQDVLIRQALEDEAEYFWRHRTQHSDFPLPDTRNLTGYMVASGSPPPERLRSAELGFSHLPSDGSGFSAAHVSERDGQRLFLEFDGAGVSELAVYFGLVPLACVLIVIYLSMWLAYRLSHRAVSPLIRLAREVDKLDPEAPDGSRFEPARLADKGDQEVIVLSRALSQFSNRINAFVERERNFTRDASHELRSPVTVIKIATDLLLNEQELDALTRQSVERIQRAAADMEELIEAFLLLARESGAGFPEESVCVNDVVDQELERARALIADKSVTITKTADCRLLTVASDKVLSVLIGNLVRNAFLYTPAGSVNVHVGDGEFSIQDSGVGIPPDQVEKVFQPFYRRNPTYRSGHGVGLAIVKRLSDRFNWPVLIQSEPHTGTRVVVKFPDSACQPINPQDRSPVKPFISG